MHQRLARISFLLFSVFLGLSSFCQTAADTTKETKSFIQVGYAVEYPTVNSGWQGGELQLKYLLNKTNTSDQNGPEGVYINPGITFFPAKSYTLTQINLGFGFYSALFQAVPRLKFDVSLLNANYYLGKVYEEKFKGKSVDIGMHAGVSYQLSAKFAPYVRFNSPGAWTTVFSEDYTSTNYISMGFQF